MRHEAALAHEPLTDDPHAFVGRAADLPPQDLLAEAILGAFAGRIALVSSFGVASVALLHMVARIDAGTPVLLIDTGKLFPETLAYRDRLVDRLGLSDVRALAPDPAALALSDPAGDLFSRDVATCCRVRKVDPLARGLAPFEAWITGRRRGQTARRAALAPAEIDAAGRVKLNPLAGWQAADVAAYMARHDLPEHPLARRGYPSIGCAPCTTPVAPGEDERAGRWRGLDREECGIHVEDGHLVRTTGAAAPLDRI